MYLRAQLYLQVRLWLLSADADTLGLSEFVSKEGASPVGRYPLYFVGISSAEMMHTLKADRFISAGRDCNQVEGYVMKK